MSETDRYFDNDPVIVKSGPNVGEVGVVLTAHGNVEYKVQLLSGEKVILTEGRLDPYPADRKTFREPLYMQQTWLQRLFRRPVRRLDPVTTLPFDHRYLLDLITAAGVKADDKSADLLATKILNSEWLQARDRDQFRDGVSATIDAANTATKEDGRLRLDALAQHLIPNPNWDHHERWSFGRSLLRQLEARTNRNAKTGIRGL